jgi:radical SAM-linked protein
MIAGAPETAGSVSAEGTKRCRAAVRCAVEGDLRYISHHDELRMLACALRRAHWPLRYSEGFNPAARLMLPAPRSVGMASDCQWALVELREQRDPKALWDSLAASLPAQCRLRELVVPTADGTPHPLGVAYEVELDPPDAETVAPQVARVLACNQLKIQRAGGEGKPPRCLDIRPYIETLVLDGLVLRLGLRYVQQRTARPSEVITELDLDADAYNHRVRRTEVAWDMELSGSGVEPVALEGTRLGKARQDDEEEG